MADERFLTHFDVSGSALTTERLRMRLAANNIANINTTRTEAGGPYKRMEAVVQEKLLNQSPFERGVSVKEVFHDPSPPRLVFNPSHPDANQDGYVAQPNVDLLKETVGLKSASMAYQANAMAVESIKKSVEVLIDIGSI